MNAEFRNAELQQLEKNLPHILDVLEELHESYESSKGVKRKQLLEYCKLDTFAMVEILEKLNSL